MPPLTRFAGREAEVDAAMTKHAGNRAAAARELGVPVTSLKSYLASHHAEHRGDRPSSEEMLRDEVARLRSALARDTKARVADERIVAAVEEAVGQIAPLARPAIDAPATTPSAHHRQLALWSDWHGGEVVDPEAVNGLNAYSWEIQEARVDELLEAMLSHKARSPELTGLDIALIGDMCSGSNHQELAETNEMPAAEQGVRMGYLIGSAIERLVEHYPEIRVTGVVGNHPRLPSKPAAKRVFDNFDWVAYTIAAQYLKRHETVTFDVPRSAAVFWEIAGLTYYVWHGDGIRSTMAGVPWGGVMRRANEIRRSHAGRRIDGFLLGHFHQANAMHDLGIFQNGSLKGTDEWVLKSFGSAGRPCQLLLTFDEAKSRLTDVRFLTPTAGL